MKQEANRLAMALNEAAKKAPSLTKNEFAELSLSYILRSTQRHDITNFHRFIAYVRDQVMPFVPDISEESASYLHLEAQGCAKIEMGEIQIHEIFRRTYGGVLGKGFDRNQLENNLGDRKTALDGDDNQGVPYIVRCVNDPEKLQPNAIDTLLGLTALCGGLACLVIWMSPNPMPAGHAQLLAALIALMSAGGYGLIRSVTAKTRKRQ